MPGHINSGTFITFEGIEGAGKSTHISLIENFLQARGREVVTTREPGGTHLGEQIRTLLLETTDCPISGEAELLMMFAARAQHINEIIQPALQRGAIVLCDRFTDSSFAYQAGGRNVDETLIKKLAAIVHSEVNPDITFLLDLDIETGLSRVHTRGASDRFESEEPGFFKSVRAAYLKLARSEPDRIKIIDAAQEIEKIQAEMIALLEMKGLC